MVLDTSTLERLTFLAPHDGRHESGQPGLYWFRAGEPTGFLKRQSFGVTLTVVAQGAKVARFRDGELRYDTEHALLVTGPAEYEAAVVEATAERPYLALAFEIPASLVRQCVLALGENRTPPRPAEPDRRFHLVDAELLPLVGRVVSQINDELADLVLPPVLEELVLRLLRSPAGGWVVAAYQVGDDHERIQQAMRFIHDHLGVPLTVEAVADAVGMSASHFAHRFRSVAQVSPMAYHKRLRLLDARRRLLQPGIRIGEVASAVGYQSASHFMRDFRSLFGASPREFQRRIRP